MRYTIIDADGKIEILDSDLAKAVKMLRAKGYMPSSNKKWFDAVALRLAYKIKRRLLNTPLPTRTEYQGDTEVMASSNYVKEAKAVRGRMQKLFSEGLKMQREREKEKKKK